LQAEDDQNCDVCGSYREDNLFSEFCLNKGMVVMFGNRGMCCRGEV